MTIGGAQECIALEFVDNLVITAANLVHAQEMSKLLNFLLDRIVLKLINNSKCKTFARHSPYAPNVLSPDLPIEIYM